MPYTPTSWEDLPSVDTPITAAELNRMEAGIDAAVEFADTHLGADPHTQYQKESEKGAAGGYASLDGSGKVPSAQIPDIAISEFLGVAANEAAMLGAVGQKGDWVIRSDENKVYVITGSDPTQIGSWTALAYPADAVVSVNGETGVVSLSAADVGAEPAGAVATHESTFDHTDIPDPTSAAENYVWTADGLGSAGWQPGGGGSPTDSYWKFSTSITDADPSNGKFKLNDALRANATFLYIDNQTLAGLNISNFTPLLAVGDQVFVQPKADASSRVRYTITGPAVDGTGYWKIPVSVSVAPVGPEIGNNAETLLLWNIAALGGTPSTHTHDDRYYTESEIDTLLTSKPDFSSGVTPPIAPTVGDRWLDTETGYEYIWVDDGTSTQWVMADVITGATAHGELSGLAADDHPQYHNDARGDSRYTQLSLYDAKGDLIVGSGDNTAVKLPIGTNGHVLTADSAEASGVKWAAAGGGGGTAYTSGTAAPSGGSDGDWYLRTATIPVLYKRVSGSWVLWGRTSSLYEQNTAYRSSPWTQTHIGAFIAASGATAAQTFDISQTGVSKSGSSYTLTAASAHGAAATNSAYGGAMTAAVTTLPGAAQTCNIGLGIRFYGAVYPYVSVNTSGVAVLTTGGTTLKTFSGTVSGTANNRFFFALVPGALLVLQSNSSGVIIDQALYASEYVQAGTFSTGGQVGWFLGGHGVVSLVALEVYG